MPLKSLFLVIALSLAASFLLWGGSLAAKHDASQALCLARMKDLAAAIRNHAVDHNGALPLAADRSRHPWRWWYQTIFPYTTSVTSFYCPGLLKEEQTTLQRSRLLPVMWNGKLLSYGMAYPVDAFQRKHGRLLLKDISNPGEKILLGESRAPILRNTARFWSKDLAPRHGGCGNFVTFNGEGICADGLPGPVPSASGSGVHDLARWTLP
ncbi:MAG TPA: hypothetical protein VNQ90_08185 [Chthoniobacteraceae bacterium]|nr:hypothetical protein [Chthoniobacteraceae bacterium]